MKGKDFKIFIFIILSSFGFSIKLFDVNYDSYSDIITFLSIMIGFKITSLSILFNTPLKKTLYDRKINLYLTELHRLRDYYKFSLKFEVFSIVLIFVVPDNLLTLHIKNYTFLIGKYLLILPVILGTVFCFIKIINDLLQIFVHPTT